jgi:hypothetical protein
MQNLGQFLVQLNSERLGDLVCSLGGGIFYSHRGLLQGLDCLPRRVDRELSARRESPKMNNLSSILQSSPYLRAATQETNS